MRVWLALANLISLIIMMLSLSTFLYTSKFITKSFDQERLNIAVNFATRETFASSLTVEDVSGDYTDLGNITLNTGNSLDIFETIMCFNYDMSLSDENKQQIANSIQSIVLSTEDGFYITQTVEDDVTKEYVTNNKGEYVYNTDGSISTTNKTKGGEYVLKWSPKIPYTVKVGNSAAALNLRKQSYSIAKADGTLKVSSLANTNGIDSDESTVRGILSTEERYSVANEIIRNAMIHEAENGNTNKDEFRYNVVLPAQKTKTGVNPIQGTGILVALKGVSYASSEKLDSVSVSGYKTTQRKNILGFEKYMNGEFLGYYYCYQGQVDGADIDATVEQAKGNSVYKGTTRYVVKNYFQTMKDAASPTNADKISYAPDYSLLSKPIAKK